MNRSCPLALLLLAMASATAFATQEGEYFRETQNLPVAESAMLPRDGLLFWLRSDTGVDTDADGTVRQWQEAGGGLSFAALANAGQPARRVAAVVGDHPAVEFAAAQHRPGGLRSPAVEIDPERGLTLFALARVAAPVHIGFLLGYGASYQTSGSLAMSVGGGAGRTLLRANTGLDAPDIGSTGGNLVGKGFVLFASRFDPATGRQTLYENGVEVGRAQRHQPLAASHPFAVGVEARGQWSFAGHMLAALAYNRALDDGDMQAVQRALFADYGLAGGSAVSVLAPQLPFAYYPSRRQMEVAVELGPERLAKARGDQAESAPPTELLVQIVDLASERLVATGLVPLDGQARGQACFAVPDLSDGEYAVDYVVGQHRERSPKTFVRQHFPFEKTAYGASHEVYPPFEPVRVKGRTVDVVGRRYTINAQGLFDSVISLDRELLAAPMRLVVETTDGQRLDWRTGWFSSGVKGRATHADQAVFETAAKGRLFNVQSTIVVQEDGCAKVTMTWQPQATPATIRRAWIDIPLRDAEVPLFHYVADNGMRFNYAGHTPRLPPEMAGQGRIEWYREAWDGWVPMRWRAVPLEPTANPAPANQPLLLWNAANPHQHGNQHRWDHRPFVPYLWLGAEERGLAFFMENERDFETDYRTPLQRIVRDGDQVIVHIDIVQRPVVLDRPRTIVFGLMASPGKPLEPAFRTRPFASGVGPVSCWGGWQCSSKYPDNQDWSIVDRIQEIRRRGKMTPDDHAWFAAKYEEVKSRWPERKINGETDWLWLTKHFAQRAADRGHVHSGIYFEEHATDTRKPEWQVFQDEWASAEFNRFQPRPANWGVFSPSYHDFVLYMANQWMSRGVSLYFDNTNPKRCYNERFGPAYRTPSGSLVYGISVFAQRDYYRRIYKLREEWNRRPAEYPIDFTLHITNTQTLPFNTWCSATLDLEQRAHTENPAEVPPEVEIDGLKGGFQLPWAPDYTRTVTFGRQAGTIPMGLDFVSGHGRHHSNQFTPAMLVRDWAMRRLHDIRPGYMWMQSAAQARQCEEIAKAFGYGDRQAVDHHNYWAENPFATVDHPQVKWLALVKRRPAAETAAATAPPQATDRLTPETATLLLLLQSYSRTEAITVNLTLPGTDWLQDALDGETFPLADGRTRITLPANFGTRLLLGRHR